MKKKYSVRKQFLIFGAPAIEDAEIQEVTESMRVGWLGTGPKVARFEKDFCAYTGGAHAVAVNSGTAALHLSILVAGIKPGEEIITTPMTFCATINAIIHAGATPVLADVDPVTMNIAPGEVEKKITDRTRALLPVHFAGRPCDLEALGGITQRHDLRMIEDCAHAIESVYRGKKTGTAGDFGCFSFYVTKNVATGEGGMVIARREEDAARIKTLALHGMTKDAWHRFGDAGYKHYHVVECGFKYNMMDLQAAIGIHQLRRVEQNWKRRQDIWNFYKQEFRDLPVRLPTEAEPGTRHAHHLFTILIDEDGAIDRDTFLAGMTQRNIGVGVHFVSIPEHPYYQKVFGWRPEEYPNAMKIGRQTVSLPFSAKLTDDDVEDVVNAVKDILADA